MFTQPQPKFKIGPSAISGQGLIATAEIKAGEKICTVFDFDITGFYQNDNGRYVNHCSTPNTRCELVGFEYKLVALRDISTDEELSADYIATKQISDLEKTVDIPQPDWK